jgi:hypothetical protein
LDGKVWLTEYVIYELTEIIVAVVMDDSECWHSLSTACLQASYNTRLERQRQGVLYNIGYSNENKHHDKTGRNKVTMMMHPSE